MTKVLVTGACGFIGSALVRRLCMSGVKVYGIDNLSRIGSEMNAMDLRTLDGFVLRRIDLSHGQKVDDVFQEIGPVDAVFHLAAQVAVTTSYAYPRVDFLDNALASFNVIEAARRFTPEAYCLYASTNKVYGPLVFNEPVGMAHSPNPYTPYGVSKATGELYFLEYGTPAIGLQTCSLRQSCIYGSHQFGVEDQGWIAWFAIANLLGKRITLYGDGKQVRDLLYVDDLIALYLECWERRLTGAYPVGGGPNRQITLREGLRLIEKLTDRPFATIETAEARPGDQPYFVADLAWTREVGLRWEPEINVPQGVTTMLEWIREHHVAIGELLEASGRT